MSKKSDILAARASARKEIPVGSIRVKVIPQKRRQKLERAIQREIRRDE